MSSTCKHCKSDRDVILTKTNKNGITRAYCKKCQIHWSKLDAPKVLLFDIETSRVKVETHLWQSQMKQKNYLGHNAISQEYFVISWVGKWLFQKETFGGVVTSKEAKQRNDKRILASLWKTLKQADFVITHNGDKFDIKNINWRFLLNGFAPNMRYQSIDTLKKSRQVFGSSSHAMDYLCRLLGYEQKHHTDYGLWEACEAGNKEALQKMYNYNANDVWMLEDLYLATRSWMRTHPNMAVFTEMYQTIGNDEQQCGRCTEVISESKFKGRYSTPAGTVYKVADCPHCGAMVRRCYKDNSLLQSLRDEIVNLREQL